jgi:hypothetical protein
VPRYGWRGDHINQRAAQLWAHARVQNQREFIGRLGRLQTLPATPETMKETIMGVAERWMRMGIIGAALLAPVLVTGCASHATVRVYDPYYSDYHVWNSVEVGYYRQWTVETHRPYREFRTLPPPEQREYWAWRHHSPPPR